MQGRRDSWRGGAKSEDPDDLTVGTRIKYLKEKLFEKNSLTVVNNNNLALSGWRSRLLKQRVDEDEELHVCDDQQLPAPKTRPWKTEGKYTQGGGASKQRQTKIR